MCHGVNLKVMKSGGITQTLEQVKQLKAMNLICMMGCMIESSLSISAYTKLSPLFDYLDLDGCFFIKDDPFKKNCVENGIIKV